MAPSIPPISNTPSAVGSQTPPEPFLGPQSQRPLRREGAFIFLSPAEQAMEDAMTRASPSPERVLGKRPRHPTDGNDTETDNETSTTQSQSLPSISNVAAASLRYASKKKLRPEQRDEVDTFLLVSAPSTYLWCSSNHQLGHGTWPTGQVICMHPVLRE